MELSDYLRILRRNWITIVVCTLLGLLVAAAVAFSIRPTYTAQTKLFVATQSAGTVSDLQLSNSFVQARVESYVQTATTPTVLEPAADSLGLTPGELAGKVSAAADPGTVIISINAGDPSPVQAAAIAQAVGESLIEAIDELESPAGGGSSPVKLSVVTPAVPPAEPSAPNTRLYLIIGFLAGLGLGLGLALLRTVLDTKVRNEASLRKITDVPVLGAIAFDSDASKKPLLTQTRAQSPRAESFLQLRTNLQFAHVSHAARTLLVTSSLPGEGKTTTATNLAIAMAQAGQSVALVDADLRRPRIHEYLGLEGSAGLTTALIGKAEVRDLLQPWGKDNLQVLTCGQSPPNPSELLGSEAMKDILTELENNHDAVIIDAPPLLPVTDAAVLSRHASGVLMVVGASRVRLQHLEKSLGALELVDADLLGIVMNFLPAKGADAYSYGYYGYETPPAKGGKGSVTSPRAKGHRRSVKGKTESGMLSDGSTAR